MRLVPPGLDLVTLAPPSTSCTRRARLRRTAVRQAQLQSCAVLAAVQTSSDFIKNDEPQGNHASCAARSRPGDLDAFFHNVDYYWALWQSLVVDQNATTALLLGVLGGGAAA